MKYLGSKRSIAKYIVPIIESYIKEDCKCYIEPFVGGANVIDKINFHKKIGSDSNMYLIALLDYVSKGGELPDKITEEEYHEVKNNKNDYENWYVGLVGFCATFGAKWFNGYARAKGRDMTNEAIRNIKKQSINLEGITFKHNSYEQYENIEGALFYCDPPYNSTVGYKDKFETEKFLQWCIKQSEKNIVIVSEYDIKNDNFIEIWQKEHSVNFSSNRESKSKRVEKLYLVKKVL